MEASIDIQSFAQKDRQGSSNGSDGSDELSTQVVIGTVLSLQFFRVKIASSVVDDATRGEYGERPVRLELPVSGNFGVIEI